MKIVYVLNGYLPNYIGGSEVYTQALAKYMQKQGYDINVIVPVYDLTKNDELNYDYENIPVKQYLDKTKSSRLYKIGIKKPEGLHRYIGLLKEIRPDIVHFQMISTSACITMYHVEETRKLGIKTALTIHMSHYSCITENLLRNNKYLCDGKIETFKCTVCYNKNKRIPSPIAEIVSFISILLSFLFKNSRFFLNIPILSSAYLIHFKKKRFHAIMKSIDAIIPITGWFKNILLLNDIPENKISVVKQALISSKEKIRSESVINKESLPLKLVFVGRIHAIKGLHVLLSALKIVPPHQYILDIYGPYNSTDPYYKKLTSNIKENNLSVNIKGPIEQKLVSETIKNYDFLCLPSVISEMAPLVIQEAFAANLPVIGSNVPGIVEEVRHGINGLIFEFSRIKKLSELISWIIENREIKKLLVKNIEEPRKFENVGLEMISIYQSLIKKE